MSYLDQVKKSLHKSSIDTSRLMSAKLRSEAMASGWPSHIARGMHVKYNDGEFTVHSHPDHRDHVLDLEYGTPSTSPTAAIRRFNNRQNEAAKFLVHNAYKHLRGHK